MWIYDGEQWTTDEGVTANDNGKRDQRPQPNDEFYPELQVIEIVPLPKPHYVPPFPRT